ncbi:hypothetical protein BFW89_23000 [Pseudomonas synxantha]|nr:hypothetical protein BFW89_23000 [Pseudomonas synxantha]
MKKSPEHYLRVTISQICQTLMNQCGSWLACDSVGSGNTAVTVTPLSQASQLPPSTAFTAQSVGVFETRIGIRQFAVILAALLWSQYEFVADR